MKTIRSVLGDAQYALRSFLRCPGLFGVIVLSAGLGIATNVILFSVANAVFLRPLAVNEADSFVNVFATDNGQGSFLLSHPEFVDISREPVFDDAVAHALVSFVVSIDGELFEATGEIVSNNYFSTLGVVPSPGRGLDTNDSTSGPTAPVAVVSHEFWQRRFNGSSDALGRPLTVNAHDFTVVGVTPKGFSGTFAGVRASIWVSTDMYDRVMPVSDTLASRSSQRFDITARLAPGSSIDAARTSVAALAVRQRAVNAANDGVRGYLVTPAEGVRPGVRGPVGIFLAGLWAIMAIVLLVACANIAGLLLVQVSTRHREIAVRQSLGASRLRIARQLMTESVLLALAGGAVGLLLTVWASSVIETWRPDVGMPVYLNISPDWKVVVFAIALALGTSVIFGVVPSLQSTKFDLVSSLRHRRGTLNASRLRNVFVVMQVALSLALLIGAGLLGASMRRASNGDPGFGVDRVSIGTVDLDLLGYDGPAGIAFFGDVARSMAQIPGIESVALARYMPLASQASRYNVEIAGSPTAVYYNVVSASYFHALGVPVLAGREFRVVDRLAAPGVAIVNESMAREFFGADAAVGRHVQLLESADQTRDVEIVGVVKDIKYRSVIESPRPYLYLPHGQHYRGLMTFHLRTAPTATQVIPNLIREIRRVEPMASIVNTGPIRGVMRYVQFSQRVSGVVLVVAGTIALVLATVGLYALIAYSVNQRTHEIGVRVAMGAQKRDVVFLIVKQGARLLLVGSVVGVFLAACLGKLLGSFVVGVSSWHALTYVVMTGILFVVGLIAILQPARRASQLLPTISLRGE